MLPTINQLGFGMRKRKKHRRRVAALLGSPQRRAVIYKIATMTPRKPNSAKRTIAKTRVIISNKRTFAKIPGVGEHFLQAHSVVLLRGHGPTDSPGINYNMIEVCVISYVLKLSVDVIDVQNLV